MMKSLDGRRYVRRTLYERRRNYNANSELSEDEELTFYAGRLPSFRGEMITEPGENVGRKIYPIAGLQCAGYSDDGGVRATLRFETLSALEKERSGENKGKRERGREREKERESRK